MCVLYLRRVQGSLLSMFCLLFVSARRTPVTSLLLIYVQIKLRKTCPLPCVNLKLSCDAPFLLKGQWGGILMSWRRLET